MYVGSLTFQRARIRWVGGLMLFYIGNLQNKPIHVKKKYFSIVFSADFLLTAEAAAGIVNTQYILYNILDCDCDVLLLLCPC